jgi:MFS transporter, MHS family, proline/betaine transporter
VPTYLKKTVGLPDNPALVMVLVVLAVLTIGVLLVGLPMLFLSSLEPAILPALFPTNVRYGAVSTGFNIAVSAFGGTTPLIAESLVAGTGNAMMPAYMLMFAGWSAPLPSSSPPKWPASRCWAPDRRLTARRRPATW